MHPRHPYTHRSFLPPRVTRTPRGFVAVWHDAEARHTYEAHGDTAARALERLVNTVRLDIPWFTLEADAA